MKIFGTSDTHLSLRNPRKSNEFFGGVWIGYVNKIEYQWKNIVGRDDIVIIAGDISWASSLNDSRSDFDFIESLPGKKIITVGNHDYWHNTSKKSHEFFFNNYRTIVPLIRNDYFNLFDDVAICAVKGYMNENHPEFRNEYRKTYNRECTRLENTLKKIPNVFNKIIVVTHYPPIHKDYIEGNNRFLNIMIRYKVNHCIYGHLHQEAACEAFVGKHKNIDFTFVACDSHNFKPLLLAEI